MPAGGSHADRLAPDGVKPAASFNEGASGRGRGLSVAAGLWSPHYRFARTLLDELIRLCLFILFLCGVHALLLLLPIAVGDLDATFYRTAHGWCMKAGFLIVSIRFLIGLMTVRRG